MSSIGDVAIHLFSPAKVVYVAYIILVVLRGVSNTSKWEFMGVSVAFIVIQVLHDDYWRIRLNAKARKAEGMPAERP
jgi:hypothetical protein